MKDENGFTILELTVAVALMIVMLSLGAVAVQHFGRVRALEGATDQVVTQLRQLQERVVSESHPLVYGARFRLGSSDWGLVQFDPKGTGTTDDTCVEVETRSLRGGMFATAPVDVSAADFSNGGTETYEQSFCRSALGATTNDKFVMFYSRGTATAGSVTLNQPALGRTRLIGVNGITGRVTRP